MKATSKGRIKIILKGSALVLWCVVIFMFSANNADESNKQSNAVFNTVIEFVNPVYDSLDTTAQAEYKDTATFIIRKLAHFSEYALLGILAFINLAMVKKLVYRGLFAAVFSCIYASSDEIHQLFVPGRAGQVRDVLIDTSGAVAGILLAILIRKIWLHSRGGILLSRIFYSSKTYCKSYRDPLVSPHSKPWLYLNHFISSLLVSGFTSCIFGRSRVRIPFLYSAAILLVSMPVRSKLL